MSEESVDVEEMYNFLISKEYITDKININLYSHTLKPSLNYIHTEYNHRQIKTIIDDYISSKTKGRPVVFRDVDFPFNFIQGKQNNTDIQLTELERIKIFFLVFFPLYTYYNHVQDKDKQEEMTTNYYTYSLNGKKNDYDNYIETIKEKNKNTSKPEFIDAYLFFINKNIERPIAEVTNEYVNKMNQLFISKLMFASYTYLCFLSNMLNDEIEWLKDKNLNNHNDQKYIKKLEKLKNDLKEVNNIIEQNKNAYILIKNDDIGLKHIGLKQCYDETNEKFIKILTDNEVEKKQITGYNDIFDKKYIISSIYNKLHCENLTNLDEHKFFQLMNLSYKMDLSYKNLLTQFVNLSSINLDKVNTVYTGILEDKNKHCLNIVKNDIENELKKKEEQKEKGGKKSRKRKHNKLKKKRKSTRKKRRKSNKKHR